MPPLAGTGTAVRRLRRFALIEASETTQYLGAMKTFMWLVAGRLTLAAAPAMAQAGGPDVVVVRTTDSFGDLRIVVTHGEGKTQVLELARKDLKQSPTGQEETLQNVFAKLYQEGYRLSGTGGGGYNYLIRNTFIFTKGQ